MVCDTSPLYIPPTNQMSKAYALRQKSNGWEEREEEKLRQIKYLSLLRSGDINILTIREKKGFPFSITCE